MNQKELAVALGLTAGQRAALSVVVAKTEDALDRLRDVEDVDGNSLRKLWGRFDAPRDSQEWAQAEFDVQRFMTRKIAGGEVTFADQENSIRLSGRVRIRELLTAEQRRELIRMRCYPVFGPTVGPWVIGLEDEARVAYEESDTDR